jgi:NAD(P)-dependent dehydrogenase (short-subunit alcohol dehydrogenase family)
MGDASESRGTPQLFMLGQKVALVTGGAGIYGTHIVRGLAESGAMVIVASRDLAKCMKHASMLQAEGLQVRAARLDLASEPSIRGLCEEIISDHGHLDILVNNAVARSGGNLHQTSLEDWESTMKVNSTGLFLACKIFSEPMQRAGSGSIINVASIYGMVGPDFSIYEGQEFTNPVDYAFAKGGMINLTRYLASFLAPYSIRVNSISPGGFRDDDTPSDFVPRYSRRTLLGRMAEPDDIKGPIVFLASDASRYITGQNLPVDGGWTAI